MILIINGVFGLIIGIVVNYLSDVLPATRRISIPTCKECDNQYSILDYLVNFKCSKCGKKHTKRSIIVLLSSICICILVEYFPFSSLSFWATLPIITFLGIIIVIDIENKLILFETSIFGLVLFLIYGLILRNWLGTFAGAIIGFIVMLVLYFLGIGFTKLVGKLRGEEVQEVALGFGDVFAGTFLGLLAGPLIIPGIVIAILAFGAYSLIWILVLLLTKKYRSFSNAQPFGPFLILGILATFYLPGM